MQVIYNQNDGFRTRNDELILEIMDFLLENDAFYTKKRWILQPFFMIPPMSWHAGLLGPVRFSIDFR